ncbi:DUF6518 family protein [Streptomyces sp. NPDC087294]|uniref:DUF6518 family protein n=1 Tax=Streptomyces sp. NPDC087294 TaxID=3365777 RepID=UPI0037FBD8C7
MSTLRSLILPPMATLAVGISLGALGPLLGTADDPVIHAMHVVLSAGWSWAALGFGVGITRNSLAQSAVLAAFSLLAGVVTYYAVKSHQGEVDETSFISKVIFWGLFAVILGSILGVTGKLAKSEGLLSLPFRLIIPLIALFESSMRLRSEATTQGQVVSTTWEVTRGVAVAAVIALIAQAITSWRSRASADRGENVLTR